MAQESANSSDYTGNELPESKHGRDRKGVFKLALGALGVVYGDIGTSPLYAIKESFHPSHGLALSSANILGVLSLVFWAIMFVITVKYLLFIMKADNHGEGGITALLALLVPRFSEPKLALYRRKVMILGLFGAGLLYGDGMITPAISVLSALEGIEVATPALKPVIVPLTILILIGLFTVQKRGTAKIGAVFGPVTLIWFLMIALMGIPWIFKRPDILFAINPLYAVDFFLANGWKGFLVLSSVVLCITGGEALYADMGHFGPRPIRLTWFWVVLPCLLINYFGQGALVLSSEPGSIENTFYGMVSGYWLYPVMVIATFATVIASQALISGAFSLTQQAVQLGYLPRFTILHTSRETEGQIYVPSVNNFLMVACIWLVLAFRESSNLAAAYGIAVTGTMVISSILFYWVATQTWGWSKLKAGTLVGAFLIVDVAFFSANITKFIHGGWVPIVVAFIILVAMMTWKRGRNVLADSLMKKSTGLSEFFKRVESDACPRAKGTAVFMTLSRDIAPSVLLHHYEHNHILHERVILLSIITEHTPEVPTLKRVRVTDLDHGFVKVVARYGYMETPDVTEIIRLCESSGLALGYSSISYYLGREIFVTTGVSGMSHWRKQLFVFMARNARSATEFFNLPPDRVIEIGSQVQI